MVSAEARSGSALTCPNDLALRQNLLVRILVFTALEAAFIAFALVCAIKPVNFRLFTSEAQSQTVFTIIFIVWHAVAIINAEHCVLHGFSSEWFHRFCTTRRLIPGHTDLVSTINSGWLARIKYFFAMDASTSYRTSFLISLALIALTSIAPSIIRVDNNPRFVTTPLSITMLTVPDGNITTIGSSVLSAGRTFIELEQNQVTNRVFEVPEGFILTGANENNDALSTDAIYESDVWRYNMSCRWERPTFNMSSWNTTWYAGGYAWYPQSPPLIGVDAISGMMPMYRFLNDPKVVDPKSYPEYLSEIDEHIGLSGYLFYGWNSTFPSPQKKKSSLILDHLPTLYHPSGFHFIDLNGGDGLFDCPLATFLICDPRTQVMNGQIEITPSNKSVKITPLPQPLHNLSGRVGNIPARAASAILGLSLLDILDTDDEKADIRIGGLAAQVFLNDSTLNFDSDNSPTSLHIGVLPIQAIQRNLNEYMAIAAKGFFSYFPRTDRSHVQGAILVDQLALVASRPLLIATIALTIGILLSLIATYAILDLWRVPPFELQALMQFGEKFDKGLNTFYSQSNQPANIHPSFILHSRTKSHLPQNNDVCKGRPSNLHLMVRLLVFAILGVTFLIFAFIFSFRNHVIDVPLSPTEIKTGFNVIFIIWQSIAIWLASEATTYAFSCEWSIQQGMHPLIPGVTDRVSRLTSNLDDRTTYFFTRRCSTAFRMAFLASLLLTALKSIVPGAISVSNVQQADKIPLNVSDLKRLTSSQNEDNENNLVFHEGRSHLVYSMQEDLGLTHGFSLEPNWIMGWPDGWDVTRGNVEYPTDVARFNFTCSWKMPKMEFHKGDTAWIANGQKWEVWGAPLEEITYDGGIVPLYRFLDVQPDSQSAFLFIGTNDSFPVSRDKESRPFVNLNYIPTLSHPHGLAINISSSITHWNSPLSSLLLCDPHMELSGGRVEWVSPNSLRVVLSGLPPVGNIPVEAATTIFTQTVVYELDTVDRENVKYISPTSAGIFLTNFTAESGAYPRGFSPRDLSLIGQNLNTFVSIASKTFMDAAYQDGRNQSNVTFPLMAVDGSGPVEKLALVGSIPVAIISLCLHIVIILAYGGLVWLMNMHPSEPFELENLLSKMGL